MTNTLELFLINISALLLLVLVVWLVIKNRYSKTFSLGIGGIVVLLLLLMPTKVYVFLMTLKASLLGEVPYAVESQYLQTEAGPNGGMGVYLYKCTRANETAYKLTISRGFVADEYYFDAVGHDLGTYRWTDDRGPHDKGPSVSLSDCQMIQKKRRQDGDRKPPTDGLKFAESQTTCCKPSTASHSEKPPASLMAFFT